MVPWRRICSLASLVLAASVRVWACGPFLYDNAELDRFSFLDPGILNDGKWNNLLAYASPPFGQASAEGEDGAVQVVIRPERLGEASSGLSNALYDASPGEDEISVAANEAWWRDYFHTVRHRDVTPAELETVLSGPTRPAWLPAADRTYLRLLDGGSDGKGLATALAQARNTKNPEPLRHRFAFWAVRALALGGDPDALKFFREFSPGPAVDLPLARAQGWAAGVLARTDAAQTFAGVQTFSSVPVFSALTRTSVYLNAAQTLTVSTYDTVKFDTVEFGSGFNTGTNTYTVPYTGYLKVTGAIGVQSGATGGYFAVAVHRNGTQVKRCFSNVGYMPGSISPFSVIIPVTAADAITIRVYSSPAATLFANTTDTWCQFEMLPN